MQDTIRHRLFRTHALATATPRERLVLKTIRTLGNPTRAQLIQATGLSGVAIFRATTDLAARGLLEIGAAVASGRGQPSNSVSIRPDALAALGISVMTDRAEAVLVDFSGVIRGTASVGTNGMKRKDVARRVREFLDDTLQVTGLQRDVVIGAGLAIAGFFVDQSNAVNPAEELDDWALIDLSHALEAEIDLPVEVENIANAAAMGERLLGIGQRLRSFAYLNFAHGFGAGLIVGGELLRGRSGNAGEIAGLLEAAGLPLPSLGNLRHRLEVEGLAFKEIGAMAARFDETWPGVEGWIADCSGSIDFIANALRYTLDCEAIVFGGMIPPTLADRLIAQVRWRDDVVQTRRGVGWPRPELLRALVTEHAAAVGVAALLLSRDYFE